MKGDMLKLIGVAVIAIAIGSYVFVNDQNGFSSGTLNEDGLYNLPSAVIVPFTALAEGSRSKVESRVNYLINTQKELAELWKFLEEPPPVPKVDFNTKVVAAVFAGEVPTVGYAISVAKVEDVVNRMVKIELTKPGDGCVLAKSVTAPYQVIELPKTSLPFTHTDTWTTKTCS